MPRKRTNEFVAGLAVLLGLAAALGVILWLGAAAYFRPHGRPAAFYVNEADGSPGLTFGSEVQIGGVSVGRITGIEYDPARQRSLYHAELFGEGFTIHADARTAVVTGLLGTPSLAVLDRGSTTQPAADAEHPALARGGLNQAMGDLATAADNLKNVSEVLRRELSTEESANLLPKVLAAVDNLKGASADVARIASAVCTETDARQAGSIAAKIHTGLDDVTAITSDAKPKVRRFLTAAADASERVDQYLQKDIADVLVTFRESSTEILKTARNLSEMSRQAKDIVAVNRESIDTMVDDLAQVSNNLKAMAKEVRRNPWRLLQTPSEKELHEQDILDAARAFSQGAADLDRAAGKLLSLTRAGTTQPADEATLQEVLKDLKETFGRFSKIEESLWEELQKPAPKSGKP